MNLNYCLFIDGSVNVKSRVGYGASLWLIETELRNEVKKSQIKIRRFENTSSTQLELQNLLWALDEIKPGSGKVLIYTDSQNILSLLERRERLEQNNFMNRVGKPLKNEALYREFFQKIETIQCKFIKVKGHKRKEQKDLIDQTYALVDRAARKALRENK